MPDPHNNIFGNKAQQEALDVFVAGMEAGKAQQPKLDLGSGFWSVVVLAATILIAVLGFLFKNDYDLNRELGEVSQRIEALENGPNAANSE